MQLWPAARGDLSLHGELGCIGHCMLYLATAHCGAGISMPPWAGYQPLLVWVSAVRNPQGTIKSGLAVRQLQRTSAVVKSL